MLLQLEIMNIALIRQVRIDFASGLNVLTGETGAGKSIVIDAINALLGGRTARELIRTGCDSAFVTGVFQFASGELETLLQEQGIEAEEDETLILSREFNVQGRNICRVNGKTVTLSCLRQVGGCLVDLHGQHDNQSLLNTARHMVLLDAFGGIPLLEAKQLYADQLEQYRQRTAELQGLYRNEKERSDRVDLLAYQIQEIKSAKLKTGEEEALLSRRNILSSSEKIQCSLSRAYTSLYESQDGISSAYDRMGDAGQELAGLARIDGRYRQLTERLTDMNYQLYDIIEEIRKEKDHIEYEPGEIEEIEDRISVIRELKRKYGDSIENILQYLSRIEQEYDRLSHYEESTRKLEQEAAESKERLQQSADQVTDLRRRAAFLLESGITEHFADLEMKHTRFAVSIQPAEEFLSSGKDAVEFLVSPNKGEPLKPLGKIASGGEMSRIMLAVKAVLAKADGIPTLIFDEIDTGISGIAAARVGEKMARLAQDHQILCVTHLARIAACAENHILIEKRVEEEMTRTHIRRLSGDGLVQEIARLLDGDSNSETTRKHAIEMLENSKNYKV